MENAMLYLGIIIGCLIGLISAWWFARKAPPLEPFFLRILKLESKSARVNTRLGLYEMQGKVEDLLAKVQRMDLELQELLQKSRSNKFLAGDAGTSNKRATAGSTLVAVENEDEIDELKRCRDVYRLFQEGLTPEDIARKLNLGKGEVELVLSLDKKPSWVIGAKNNFK